MLDQILVRQKGYYHLDSAPETLSAKDHRPAYGSDGDYFELTGEAVLTFIGTSRNQKYIEDSSAAILIDDNNGTITTSYSIGDGITGIKGRLSSFANVTQFVPVEDPGAASSTGNAITLIF